MVPVAPQPTFARIRTALLVLVFLGMTGMSEVTPAVTDEAAVEEAEAALSTVDSEFGRTTDPVRMYMREMGSVELLTREGEIEIAKRIEDGLKHMIQAISACPTTIAEILRLAEKIQKEEMRVDEVVDGLVDPNADEDEVMEAEVEAAADEDDEALDGEEEDEDGAAVQSADMLKLKEEALKRFAVIHNYYGKMMKVLAKEMTRRRFASVISRLARRAFASPVVI